MNISKAVKFTRVENAVAAGQTAVESDSVDMVGYQAVAFLVQMGAITSGAATSAKLQTSSDDSNWNDLEGSSVTIADDKDNKMVLLDLSHPLERYIRCVVSRATQNSAVDSIVAVQYLAKIEPVTQGSTVLGTEFHHAPAEGTA